MPSTFALTLSKWALDAAARLIRADVRLHNAEVLEKDMSVILTVNHFTRLETLLVPWIVYRETGLEVTGLAASELFRGRAGEFLKNTGTLSTKAPDRDTIIVHSLLKGEHPWMIFPEGAMIKDRKVINARGQFEIYNDGLRRPPHKGAAVLALRAAFYRHKLACIHNRPGQPELRDALEKFKLDSLDGVLGRRTCIVPVNITYYPIRAHDNLALRIARRLNEDLSPRAIEELSVEGTVLGEDTDIDITLGAPIDVMEYLDTPQNAALMACGLHDLDDLEQDPASLFNDAARALMARYMREIYELTTVNYDHLFASIIRYQDAPPDLLPFLPVWSRTLSEEDYRRMIFRITRRLPALIRGRPHNLLRDTARDLLYGEKSPKFLDFLELAIREKILQPVNGGYEKVPESGAPHWDFHDIRRHNTVTVIANEAEPLTELQAAIHAETVRSHRAGARAMRIELLRAGQDAFEEAYARHYDPELSKPPHIGRPFLLQPYRPRAGIVLSHGYMAAPAEVRALAQHLYRKGYAVYGVRLAGHGTAPADLAQCRWEDWYESFSRGYAIMKTITPVVFAGGFSTGGCIALMAAARKDRNLAGVFSICAPLKLQNYSVHLAPSIITLNALLKKVSAGLERWDYVENRPENAHINYTRNPLTGVRQLVRAMTAMDEVLPEVHRPALVVQGSGDNTVAPVSARLIFDRLGSEEKELALFHRDRHGIINGRGSTAVFERVYHFLENFRGFR
jgi:esterase/lipase/1-acyl-sn-glycerol-3-phosphate acyltransferase